MNEHLYLLLNPKTIKAKNGVEVIKLGRTNCIKRRKGEHRITDDQNVLILFRIHKTDIKQAEDELINEFDKLFNKFEGKEYYTGDKTQMCMIFNNILMKYMIKTLSDKKVEIKQDTKENKEVDKLFDNLNNYMKENDINKIFDNFMKLFCNKRISRFDLYDDNDNTKFDPTVWSGIEYSSHICQKQVINELLYCVVNLLNKFTTFTNLLSKIIKKWNTIIIQINYIYLDVKKIYVAEISKYDDEKNEYGLSNSYDWIYLIDNKDREYGNLNDVFDLIQQNKFNNITILNISSEIRCDEMDKLYKEYN
jgi:hypothetical protein